MQSSKGLQRMALQRRLAPILVTAKGMPDMATRAFLHSLCTALPHLQQFGGDSSSWLPDVTST